MVYEVEQEGEEGDSEARPASKIVGVQCYRYIVTILTLQCSTSLPVAPKDFGDLLLFRFLAPADLQDAVLELIEKLQRGGAAPAAKKSKTAALATAPSAASGSASGSSTDKKKKADLAKDRAIAFFT